MTAPPPPKPGGVKKPTGAATKGHARPSDVAKPGKHAPKGKHALAPKGHGAKVRPARPNRPHGKFHRQTTRHGAHTPALHGKKAGARPGTATHVQAKKKGKRQGKGVPARPGRGGKKGGSRELSGKSGQGGKSVNLGHPAGAHPFVPQPIGVGAGESRPELGHEAEPPMEPAPGQ